MPLHDVVHTPTGWVVAAGLTLPQANAIRHALAGRPDGSALVEGAAAGNAEALRALHHLLESVLAAVLRQEAIEAAEAGTAMPESNAATLPASHTVQRLKVALSAISDIPWVVDVVRGVVIVRPPHGRAAHRTTDLSLLGRTFGVMPDDGKILIPPEGRVPFVAKAEAEALRVLKNASAASAHRTQKKASRDAGGGSRMVSGSPLALLLARILGEAHEPLDFAEIVQKVKRSRKSETPAEILKTLEAMCRDGYARQLPGPTFVAGAW